VLMAEVEEKVKNILGMKPDGPVEAEVVVDE